MNPQGSYETRQEQRDLPPRVLFLPRLRTENLEESLPDSNGRKAACTLLSLGGGEREGS